MDTCLAIKHGTNMAMENPRTQWSFEEDHHWFSWSLFQPAMFDYRKGTCLEVDATATKGHNWASDTKPSPSAKVSTRAVAAWDHGQHQLMKLAVFFSGFSIINHPAVEGLSPPLDSGNLVLPKFPHTEPRSAPPAHDLAEVKNNLIHPLEIGSRFLRWVRNRQQMDTYGNSR